MGRKKKKGDPSKAVAYLRVSTEEQHLGPEAQRVSIEAWASRSGIDIVSWHEDHVSGGAPIEKRPALLSAIDDVETNSSGVLVVAKRDRLARDVVAAAMIEQLVNRVGSRVVSAAGEGTDGDENDPNAQLMKGLVDLFAQHERAVIRSRTKAALAVKKAKGFRVGSVPYGRSVLDDGKLIDNPDEQSVIKTILELKTNDKLSERKIVEWLKLNECRMRGKFLNQTQIHRILSQYVGKCTENSEH